MHWQDRPLVGKGSRVHAVLDWLRSPMERALLAVTVLLIFAEPAWPNDQGRLTGTVTDKKGADTPAADVTARNTTTGVEQSRNISCCYEGGGSGVSWLAFTPAGMSESVPQSVARGFRRGGDARCRKPATEPESDLGETAHNALNPDRLSLCMAVGRSSPEARPRTPSYADRPRPSRPGILAIRKRVPT